MSADRDDDSEEDLDESEEQLEETDDEEDDDGSDEEEEPPKLSFMSGGSLARTAPIPPAAPPKQKTAPTQSARPPRKKTTMPKPTNPDLKITATFHELERKLGRRPTTLEVADAAGVEGSGNQGRASKVATVLRREGLQAGTRREPAPPPPPSSSSGALETAGGEEAEEDAASKLGALATSIATATAPIAASPLHAELATRREAAVARMLAASDEVRAIDTTLAMLGAS